MAASVSAQKLLAWILMGRHGVPVEVLGLVFGFTKKPGAVMIRTAAPSPDDFDLGFLLYKHRRFFAPKSFLADLGLPTSAAPLCGKFVAQACVFEIDSGQCVCSEEDVERPGELFMWDDFVDMPMVWCDRCGRRSVICVYCEPQVFEAGGRVSYTYPLIQIARVIGGRPPGWEWTPELCRPHPERLPSSPFPSTGPEAEKEAKGVRTSAAGIGLEADAESRRGPTEDEAWTSCGSACDSTNIRSAERYPDEDHVAGTHCMGRCPVCKTEVHTSYWSDF